MALGQCSLHMTLLETLGGVMGLGSDGASMVEDVKASTVGRGDGSGVNNGQCSQNGKSDWELHGDRNVVCISLKKMFVCEEES
ncbi:MAG: hypothetical protein BYD32DRAFT_408010 [Podila humilis]|nr:MAG: hypothetical protein BYD32DRAFT_408010 [Podila humilis]